MKSRIQLSGVEHGSKDMVLWQGDLPQISGIPGMRIVLNDLENDKCDALQFRQVVLEIDKATGHIEQVVYVLPVDKSRARLLVEEFAAQKEAEGKEESAESE